MMRARPADPAHIVPLSSSIAERAMASQVFFRLGIADQYIH